VRDTLEVRPDEQEPSAFDDPVFRSAWQHLERRVKRGEVTARQPTTDEDLADLVISEGLPEVGREFAREMTGSMRRLLGQYRRIDRGFRRRLQNSWGEGLDRLWLLWFLVEEAGERFAHQEHPRAARENDLVYEALTRLHARACLIGYEILCLLDGGLASGAQARWRALHEVAVVASFVKQHGAETAERFLLHARATAYAAAVAHNRFAERLRDEPLPSDEIERLRDDRDALRARFGPCYHLDNGWALQALAAACDPKHVKDPRCRASIARLEEAVELDHWRPYYRMASLATHATARSTEWTLGGPDDERTKMVGPSDGGIADPGQGLAISLLQVIVTLLTHRVNLERLAVLQGLLEIQTEAIAELMRSNELEKKRRTSGRRHWHWIDALLRRRPR
jgi:hypothetical protein